MRLNSQSGANNGFTTLVSFVIVAAVLYLAKEVFIPIALASLLSFLLAPLVVRLGRWGVGKILSIVTVVFLSSCVIAVLGWLVTAQVIHLAEQLPQYQQNLRAKVAAVKKTNRDGVFSKATGVFKELQKEMDAASPDDELTAGTEKPLPVELRRPKPTPFELIGSMAGPVLKPLATAGAVVFFVILMLFQREDLRERFLKLAGGGELSVATQAVDDAAQRVSRYLLMQLVVNATYGLPIGIGLYFIGVPNAFLWGLLATLLRFIPFVGPWIAACFPIALAIAVDPGWTKPIATVALFVVIELLSNNVVEPWLYGASTGVSNIALLVAAIFWTWLWGAPGLLLSTPLTVCLLVLGKYVPGLAFLNVLLGSDPVLEPEARFYQRMLAMDEDELLVISERFVRERSLIDFYDCIAIPALALAEQDRHKGALAEVRQAFILQSIRDLIETLGEQAAEPAKQRAPELGTILCIPARDEVDELVALMLAQSLERRGVAARALSAKALIADWTKQIQSDKATVVCISAVPPFAVTPARQICHRLKQEFPALKVVAGIWSAKGPLTEVSQRLGSSCADALVGRLPEAIARAEAILESERLAREHAPARLTQQSPTAPIPASPPAPSEPGEIFASVIRQAAKVLNVPVSLISVIDTDRDFWQAHGGVPPELTASDVLRETAIHAIGATAEDILDVADVTEDSRFSSDPLLVERGIRFFVAVPLRTSDGHVVGTFCVTDTQPHEVSDRVRTLLRSLADRLIQEVEQRHSGLVAATET